MAPSNCGGVQPVSLFIAASVGAGCDGNHGAHAVDPNMVLRCCAAANRAIALVTTVARSGHMHISDYFDLSIASECFQSAPISKC